MATSTRSNRKDTKTIPLIPITPQGIWVQIREHIPFEYAILIGTIVLLALLFPLRTILQTVNVPKLGEASRETIISPFTFDIVLTPDEYEIERKKAIDGVLLLADYDPSVHRKMQEKSRKLKQDLRVISSSNLSDSAKSIYMKELSKELPLNTIRSCLKYTNLFEKSLEKAEIIMDKGVIATLLVQNHSVAASMRVQYNSPFQQVYLYDKSFIALRRNGIESTVLTETMPVKEVALEQVIKKLKDERIHDDEYLNAMYEILYSLVSPNVTLQVSETLNRKEQAAKDVPLIRGKVIKDTEIVRKHQEVTYEIVQKLKSLQIALNKMENNAEKKKMKVTNIGRLLLIIIPFLFVVLYFHARHKSIVKNPSHLLAIASILISQIILIRVGLSISSRLFDNPNEVASIMPELMIPISVASLLAAILFNAEIAIVLSLYVSIYLGLALDANQFFFLFAFSAGCVTVLSSRKMRYRWDFFKTIPLVVFVNVILLIAWHIVGYRLSGYYIFQNIGFSCVNAIASTFIAMMLTPIFERLFDITTDMTLIELSDMNHPVLKRLSIEAAGTHNHSVMVGNLAESAAEKIGANALLARVASYYHDIGKIEKSDYFVENCLMLDRNRHNKLAPSMSALIICSHVKDGAELARKYRLPRVIQDAILQHHGTSTVSFFYEKALELDPHKQVQEQDFQYPGPIPQTRENAIIMLADSVEAASRSLGTSSPKLLRELVKKIIRDKFLSSQLDQCTLTLRDLDSIVDGFMPVLQGMFHSRIEYPSKSTS